MSDYCGQAVFGDGGEASEYRYLLTRDLRPPLMRGQVIVRRIAFVMLNPSTATAELDDPTIRRCIGFARSLGGDFLEVGNLFALRATDPKALYRHSDPIGRENNGHLRAMALRAHVLICAWGSHGAFLDRGVRVEEMLADASVAPMALSVTSKGEPGHPLYLPRDARPFALGNPRVARKAAPMAPSPAPRHHGRPRGPHRPRPSAIIAGVWLDLLETVMPALESDYHGQTVLEAIREAAGESARLLVGARYERRGM